MDAEEFEESRQCSECGELLDDVSPAFGFAAGHALCFDCATRRGGEYDVQHDRWGVPPALFDLPGSSREQSAES